MQLSVTFNKEKIFLPIATTETIQGLLYRAVGVGDAEYFEDVHDTGSVLGKRKYKLFSFSELKGKYIVEDKKIIYLSDAILEIRSANAYFIQLMHQYFLTNSTVMLGSNEVRVSDVVLTDEIIFDSEVKIRTLSPITVYSTDASGYTRFYSPMEEGFYKAVEMNARRKWMSVYKSDEDFSFSIEPTENKHYVKRATKFKSTYITAWHGSFVLKGSPKVLNFLFNTGLGVKNSQGFGMFEVIPKRLNPKQP